MADVLPAIPAAVELRGTGRPRVRTDRATRAKPPAAVLEPLLGVATGPYREVATADGPVWAAPMFDGFVALGQSVGTRRSPSWPTFAYSPVYKNWTACDSVEHAAARAGYGVRAEAGRDARVAVSRTLVVRPSGRVWTAFACARGLTGDAAEAHAVVPLADDLQGIVGGYLSGLTPPEVLLDFLAEHVPPELRERFANLAGRYV